MIRLTIILLSCMLLLVSCTRYPADYSPTPYQWNKPDVATDKKQQCQQKRLSYNCFQNEWQYTYPGQQLKYNAFENKWEYAYPWEWPKYNYFENKWEY